MIEIDKFRQELRISAVGSVDILVDSDIERKGAELTAKFNCLACDRALGWTGRHNRYECPECGIELTAQEAIDLCSKYEKLIAELAKDSGRKQPFWKKLFK